MSPFQRAYPSGKRTLKRPRDILRSLPRRERRGYAQTGSAFELTGVCTLESFSLRKGFLVNSTIIHEAAEIL